jgi:subtilisin family serine protease
MHASRLGKNGTRAALALAFVAVTLLQARDVLAQAPSSSATPAVGSWGQPYSDNWGLERIGLDGKPTGRPARASVIVAVIDSGVDYTHPDLPLELLWRNAVEELNGVDDDRNGYIDDVLGWNYADGNNTPWDLAGHGTHVIGIIVAVAADGQDRRAASSRAKILPLKVLNFIGRGRSAHIAAAIHYAIAQHAKVINLSIGGAELSTLEQRAIQAAHEAGIVTVIAAGNEGRDVTGHPLAKLDSVLFVAASDPLDRRARFSNWGWPIDVTAPGVDILSLRARDADLVRFSGAAGYTDGAARVGEQLYRASGTSFAAAFVSGVAARLFSLRPELTNVEVARLIAQTAHDLEAPGVDTLTGYGRIDALAAMAADPKQFVEARIEAVDLAVTDGVTHIRVLGTADADRFGSATLRAAPERFPDDWIDVVKPLTAAVRGAPLAELDSGVLRGSRRWTLQLNVVHANGQKRESRFVVDLGGAP